jgi:hypothetical protein
MLHQLIYASVRNSNCSDAEIKKILDSSNRNNGKKDITGVLLYSPTKFLQVLEGDKDLIVALYENIKKDDRHKNVIMISLKTISERHFPSWQMGSKELNSDNFSFITHMSDKERKDFESLFSGNDVGESIQLIRKLLK